MALLLGLFAALCWSLHDLAARYFAPQMGGFRLGLFTEFAGLVLLLPLFLHVPQAGAGDWLLLLVLGLSYGAAVAGLFKAFALAPVSIVGPLTAGYPALVVVWGLIHGLAPSPAQYLCMAAILAGSVVVGRNGPDDGGIHAIATGKFGEVMFWIVLADVCFAAAIVMGQKLGPVFGEARTAGLLRGPACLLLLPFAWRETAPRSRLTPGIVTALVVMALLDVMALTGINYMGTLPGKELGAMGISAYGAVAVLLATLFLGERVALGQWLGVILIGAGVAGLGVQAG